MKRIISLLLILIICLSISPAAFASPDCADEVIAAVKHDGPNRAEETIWYFREYDGVLQMRLWSITYQRWLTDWIPVGPA